MVLKVQPTPDDVADLEELYSTLSRTEQDEEQEEQHQGVHREFSDFLCMEKRRQRHLAVRFRDVTTWGVGGESVRAKTFLDAVWRTMIGRDIYEWTIRPWLRGVKNEELRPLIRGVGGAVHGGEMMLYVHPLPSKKS